MIGCTMLFPSDLFLHTSSGYLSLLLTSFLGLDFLNNFFSVIVSEHKCSYYTVYRDRFPSMNCVLSHCFSSHLFFVKPQRQSLFLANLSPAFLSMTIFRSSLNILFPYSSLSTFPYNTLRFVEPNCQKLLYLI